MESARRAVKTAHFAPANGADLRREETAMDEKKAAVYTTAVSIAGLSVFFCFPFGRYILIICRAAAAGISGATA